MERLPQTPDTYDAIYRSGGNTGTYHLPYQRTRYYALFKRVLQALKVHQAQSVLEVGCGTGAMADMIVNRTRMDYRGFDFSSVAVEKAKELTGQNELFSVANALELESYKSPTGYDSIVCTEVLEHINEDREVLALWPAGSWCVLSVPNFDSNTHVRFFQDEEQVRKRYQDLVSIERIERVKVPRLPDNHWRKQIEALWAQRRSTSKILELMGFGEFDEVGGWFLFTGTIRKQ